MKITNTETYTTKVFTIEDETTGQEYTVTKSDDYMEPFIMEYHIVDEDNNEVEDQDIIDKLITVVEEQ